MVRARYRPGALRALSRWLTIARRALVTGKVGQAATALAVNGGPLVELRTAGSRLDKALQAWNEALAGLNNSLKFEAQGSFSEPVEKTDLDRLTERFERMGNELESLHHWVRFQHDLQAMRQGPLSAFVSRALSEQRFQGGDDRDRVPLPVQDLRVRRDGDKGRYGEEDLA